MATSALPPALQAWVDQFDRWSTRQLTRAETTHQITRPLYHYTDSAGLRGIVQNQEVWFTSYLHMNDPSELLFGMEIAGKVLKDVASKSEPVVRLFCDMVDDLFQRRNFGDTFGFFVACFSRAHNDLGQWRAYGDNGRGFALGLAPRVFQVYDKLDRKPHENVFVGSVVYGRVQTRRRYRTVIGKAAAIITAAREQSGGAMQDKTVGIPFLREMANVLIASHLIWISLTSKHEAYAHEREVRLIILGLRDKLAPHVETRSRKGAVVPFIKSAMPMQAKRNITEIVIGPAAPSNAEDGVRALLHGCGIDRPNVVCRSDIPYRAL